MVPGTFLSLVLASGASNTNRTDYLLWSTPEYSETSSRPPAHRRHLQLRRVAGGKMDKRGTAGAAAASPKVLSLPDDVRR